MMNTILILLIIIHLFYLTKRHFKNSIGHQKVFLILLLLCHFTFMGFAYKSTIDYPGYDAYNFYKNASSAHSWLSLFSLGSSFMSFLIYPLVKAGMSIFVFFLLFSTISYHAFLLFFDEMSMSKPTKLNIYGIPISQFLFLLPSLHYWSGFLGKDVLVFYILTYLLFEFKKRNRLNFIHAIALLVLLLLRPHFFVAAILALLLYFFTQKEATQELKIKLSVLALGIVAVSIPIIMRFVNISSLTSTTILAKWEEINWYALNSGSGVDLYKTSYIGRVGLLLFRPLFYDVTTNYKYYISIENSFVLVMVFIISYGIFSLRKQIKLNNDVKLSLLLGICILLMLSVYIYNLGLASRMRLMIMPFLFYVLHKMYCTDKEQK